MLAQNHISKSRRQLRATKVYDQSQMKRLLLVVSMVLGLCCPVLAQDDPCSGPTEALASTDWQSIKPPHFPVEVMFSNSDDWIGVDRVFGTGEHLQSQWRRALPFFVPTMVQSFEGTNTSTLVHNASPVFYLHATEIASFFPSFDPEKVRLLRLKVRQDHRDLPVSKGVTQFTFASGTPNRFLVPISVRRLSQTLMELKPRDRLRSGQYLIAIGNQENEGFEFEIGCSR